MDQSRLKQLMTYNPDTGVFSWIEPRGPRPAGPTPYRAQLTIDGVAHSSSRLAWLYMTGEWPTGQVKCRNGMRDDIRWGNLYESLPPKAEINAATLRRILNYSPDTGVFTWLQPAGKLNAGAVAGSPNGSGYVHIQIAKKLHKAHRLAWLYMTGEWPTLFIDHRNMITGDNRWDNLRQATRSQNACNKGVPNTSKSGVKGVESMPNGTFLADVTIDGKNTYLGTFATLEEAHAVVCAAREQMHGEFARH